MQNIDLLGGEQWKPLESLGFTHPFFTIEADPVFYTWMSLAVLMLLVLPVPWILRRHGSFLRFLLLTFIRTFMDFCTQTLEIFSYNHFCFIAALFLFTVMCNIINIFPYCEEPTRDINTTLALGTVSFLYTQAYTIKAHGWIAYIKEYFSPFFIMAPLNVVGKIANIISMSFRLFGNIFGGSVIAQIYLSAIQGSLLWELAGIGLGLNLIITFFGLFEGFLQAFVFASLSLTYLALAIQKDESDEQGETA